MENFDYKDENGRIQSVKFDTVYGIRPHLSTQTVQWSVVANVGDIQETTEFTGIKPKRKTT